MEQYGKILLIAMPVFLVLVLFEKWYGWRKGKDTVLSMDMISSISSGVTNVTKDVLGLSLSLITYTWLVNTIALTHIKATWLVYLVTFISLDLSGYIVHRLAHQVNFFWNNHIIHHSSEEFNLACALRQNVSIFVKLFVVLLLPAALLGVPNEVIVLVAPLHLFAQFWYHTQHINKMGFLEKIIVTPSHHRVHHAVNKEYIDKNYGQIFIFWDKWFGTFQEELAIAPPVYGITRPVRTWNPVKINFQHMWLMAKDAWRAKQVKDKFRIWLMPTGWRPQDVADKYPVYKIEDVYNFEKHTGHTAKLLVIWSWIQMLLLLLFTSFLFGNIAAIGSPGIFIYGGFIFLFVYAYTELMDGNPYALAWEGARAAFGIGIALYNGWFGINHYFFAASYILIGYFVLSFFMCLIITRQKYRTVQSAYSIPA